MGRLKELDREDTRKRPDGIVLRMTWKVYACPKGMCSPGINGEGELRGHPANPGSPGKMAVKTERVCVCVTVCVCVVGLACFPTRWWKSLPIMHSLTDREMDRRIGETALRSACIAY